MCHNEIVCFEIEAVLNVDIKPTSIAILLLKRIAKKQKKNYFLNIFHKKIAEN